MHAAKIFFCAGGRKNLGNSDHHIKESTTLEDAFRCHTWPHTVEFPILRLDVDAVSGEDLQTLVAKVYASPPAVIARTKKAIHGD